MDYPWISSISEESVDTLREVVGNPAICWLSRVARDSLDTLTERIRELHQLWIIHRFQGFRRECGRVTLSSVDYSQMSGVFRDSTVQAKMLFSHVVYTDDGAAKTFNQ